jgi:hypothetical protein
VKNFDHPPQRETLWLDERISRIPQMSGADLQEQIIFLLVIGGQIVSVPGQEPKRVQDVADRCLIADPKLRKRG